MANFSSFLSNLSVDPKERGTQFEHFVKWFLLNDRLWSSQVDRVWLWREYPERWGRDLGIDLVFKHKNGDLWAVQAKCYSESTTISKPDVDSFISESPTEIFKHRLLIASTDRLNGNAKSVCDRQRVTRFLLSDFEASSTEFPSRINDLYKRSDPPKPKPRSYQNDAIASVVSGFQAADRGQLIMACGTGKTYTSLWIKEALDSKLTLILLPSLGLLSQTLNEWTKAANHPFDVLCVCSDSSVGNQSDDENYHSVSELPFPVTSEVKEISEFLTRTNSRVVFSTYQSTELIELAQKGQSEKCCFDLIIADEAHRCAGVAGTAFARVLDQSRINGKKRLFATATPRTYSKQITNSAEGRGIEIVGMDDESIFGKRFFTLTFGEAIRQGLLTDYRVVIVGIDDEMLASWISNKELVKTDTGLEVDAKSLAASVGLLKAIKNFDLQRMITFHSRVSGAAKFSADIQLVQKWMPDREKFTNTLSSDYVSGEMTTLTRRQKINKLRDTENGSVELLSNAKCLAEGVDIPALDGVAFIDPRSSQVDIIQAVGRAIRLSHKKKFGTIVLPIFLEKGSSPEDVITQSDFKQIWNVLAALKAHDETFASELSEIRTALGRTGNVLGNEALGKIVIDVPRTVDHSFVYALRTELVVALTPSWDEWFGRLQRYIETNHHSLVPAKYLTDDQMNLGGWVSRLRNVRDRKDLSPERVARLNSLEGWIWDPLEIQWEKNFSELQTYVSETGNALVPASFITVSGVKLGTWVTNQRAAKTEISELRRQRLESLNGWSWNPIEDLWERNFTELEIFVLNHQHALVPTKFKTESGLNLGLWVSNQRAGKESLSTERINRLESLKGWLWNPLEQMWENSFLSLKEFSESNNSCEVSEEYITNDCVKLRSWIRNQRSVKNKLSPQKKSKLESLTGWQWDPFESKWEANFFELEKFSNESGNCKLPKEYVTKNGVNLRTWINNQRSNKASLSTEKIQRLESLIGWEWDPLAALWELNFLALKEYVSEYGDAKVPNLYVAKDGIKLGSWVSTLRKRRDKLSDVQRSQLDELNGWAWKVR